MLRFYSSTALIFLCAIVAVAQTAQPLPTFPSPPQYPSITAIRPNGGTRGTTVELNILGKNLSDAPILVSSAGGSASIAKEAKPTDGQVRFEYTIPPDAPVGVHRLRVATKDGISSPLLFCIDDLPQVQSIGSNKSVATAQPLSGPCVVVGTVEPESGQFFRLKVAKGQQLSFDVLARRIGSPLDPTLLLRDAKTGADLPGLYSEDAPGCRTDARLRHTFSDDREIVIEVRDAVYAGGAEHFFRLRIGDFPLVLTAFPMKLRAGTETAISFTGTGTEGVPPVSIRMPTDRSGVDVCPNGRSGHCGWPVPVSASDIAEITEVEPNDDPMKPQEITPPIGISGRFATKGDVDRYTWIAKKGESFWIQAETIEIASPADVLLTLRNAAGTELAKSDPQKVAAINHTAQADGPLTLKVEHLNFLFGPNEVYHLRIVRQFPDVDAVVLTNRVHIPQDGLGYIPLFLRRNDVAGPVEFEAIGNPGVQGKLTLPAGSKSFVGLPILLPITAKPKTEPGTIFVQVRFPEAKPPITRLVPLGDGGKSFVPNLNYPPYWSAVEIGFAVVDEAFRVRITPETLTATGGKPTSFTATIERRGFAGEISLAGVGLPGKVTIEPPGIPKDAVTQSFTLTAAADSGSAEQIFVLRAQAKINGRDTAVFSNPILLKLAPELQPKQRTDPAKK